MRFDFDDVVEFFIYLGSVNFQPALEIDYNRNGSSDADDVVTLFRNLVSSVSSGP